MEPGRLGPSVAEALRASVSPCVKRRLGGWFGRADTPRAQHHSWPAVPSAQGGRGHLTLEAHPAGTPKRRSHQMAGTGQAPPFSHPQGRSPGQETQTNGSRRQTSERRHSSFQQVALAPPPPSLLARGPTTAPRGQHCCLASARRDPSPSTPGPGWASPPGLQEGSYQKGSPGSHSALRRAQAQDLESARSCRPGSTGLSSPLWGNCRARAALHWRRWRQAGTRTVAVFPAPPTRGPTCTSSSAPSFTRSSMHSATEHLPRGLAPGPLCEKEG